jgi:hypothetical protein
MFQEKWVLESKPRCAANATGDRNSGAGTIHFRNRMENL